MKVFYKTKLLVMAINSYMFRYYWHKRANYSNFWYFFQVFENFGSSFLARSGQEIYFVNRALRSCYQQSDGFQLFFVSFAFDF